MRQTPFKAPVSFVADRGRSKDARGNWLPITFDWQMRLYSFMITVHNTGFNKSTPKHDRKYYLGENKIS